MAATTKGSIADRACDESPFFPTSDIAFGFIPNDSNDTFPSRHCSPTLPIKGDVEHANIESFAVLFLNPLGALGIEEQQNEVKAEDEKAGLTETASGSFGLQGSESKGIEDTEEVDMGGGF